MRKIITELGAQDTPVIDVFNKTDLLYPARRALLQAQHPEALLVSAGQKMGLTELLEKVEEAVARKWKLRRITLRPAQLGLLGLVYEKSLVIGRQEKPSGALELSLLATDGNYQSILKKLQSC